MKDIKKALERVLSQEEIGRCDFHTHTFLSDGVLLPIEQLRRAHVLQHQVYAITDHGSLSNLDIIEKVTKDCQLAAKHWGIAAIPGIELTHVPVPAIEEVAEKAIEKGAKIVVIHGETIAEPVEKGTNLAAARSSLVDILAHPGVITKEEVVACQKNNVFLELTSRKDHSLTNGHVAKLAKEHKGKLIQNTDTHTPDNMLSYKQAEQMVLGAGLSSKETNKILQENTRGLIERVFEKI
jgi:putative hydrolase